MKAVRTLDDTRAQVLEQHEALRELVRRTRRVLSLDDEPSALKRVVSELAGFFLKHLKTEERVLFPIIRDLDPWGPARVDRLLDGHRQQRILVAALLDQLRQEATVAVLVADVDWFVHLLEADMAEEEEMLLSLSDDCVMDAQECG